MAHKKRVAAQKLGSRENKYYTGGGPTEDEKLLREIFRMKLRAPRTARGLKTRVVSSPERLCRYLRCSKDEIYFRRTWVTQDYKAVLEKFNSFLAAEVEVVSAFGRSRATYRVACRGEEKDAAFIDAMMFTRWRGKNLVFSVGPLDPLYYGETTTVFDVLGTAADKALVDELFERFFSEERHKNRAHKVDRYGDIKEIKTAAVALEDIVLPDETRRVIVANTLGLLAQRESYKKNGIPLKRGLIFEGPPGNGKTMVCKALAASGQFTVFWIMPGELSDLPGVYEKAVRHAPSIVMFEDIDLIGSSRAATPQMLGTILNSMDGLVEAEGVITIATTNDSSGLDTALANRPNRFDVRVSFANPETGVRLEMLRQFTARQKLAKGVDLKAWAERTDGLSGAELREFCYLATKAALDAGRLDESGRAILAEEDLENGLSVLKTIFGRDKRVGFSG